MPVLSVTLRSLDLRGLQLPPTCTKLRSAPACLRAATARPGRPLLSALVAAAFFSASILSDVFIGRRCVFATRLRHNESLGTLPLRLLPPDQYNVRIFAESSSRVSLDSFFFLFFAFYQSRLLHLSCDFINRL